MGGFLLRLTREALLCQPNHDFDVSTSLIDSMATITDQKVGIIMAIVAITVVMVLIFTFSENTTVFRLFA